MKKYKQYKIVKKQNQHKVDEQEAEFKKKNLLQEKFD